LPKRQISGLKEALLTLHGVKGIGVVHMDENDVIRHKLVKDIIEAYKNLEIE
jgi:phosphate starvation-inducible PhoH-like protein